MARTVKSVQPRRDQLVVGDSPGSLATGATLRTPKAFLVGSRALEIVHLASTRYLIFPGHKDVES